MKKIKKLTSLLLAVLILTSIFTCALPTFAVESSTGTPNTYYVDGIDDPFTTLGSAVTAAKTSPLHKITLGGDCTLTAPNITFEDVIVLYDASTAGEVIIDGGKTDSFEGYSMEFTWTDGNWYGIFLGYGSSLTMQNMNSLSFKANAFSFWGDGNLKLDNISYLSAGSHLIKTDYKSENDKDTDGVTNAEIDINNVDAISVGTYLLMTAADSSITKLNMNKVSTIANTTKNNLFNIEKGDATINANADNTQTEVVARTSITSLGNLLYVNNKDSDVSMSLDNYVSVLSKSGNLLFYDIANDVYASFKNIGFVDASGTFIADVQEVLNAKVDFINISELSVQHCVLSAQTGNTAPNVEMSFENVNKLYSKANVLFYSTVAPKVDISLNKTNVENANSIIQTGGNTVVELNAVESNIKITGNNPIIKSASTKAITVNADKKSSFILDSAKASFADGSVTLNDFGASFTVCAAALNSGITLPTVPVDGKTMLGWSDGTNLVKDGVVYTASSATEAVTFTAKYFTAADFGMIDGAALRTKDGNGIRFQTTVSAELKEILGGNVKFGTLIALGSVDPSTATEVVDIKQTKWGNADETVYNAALINIPDTAYAYQIKLAGRGYMTVTYADGSTATFYTAFNTDNNVRSLYDIAVNLNAEGKGTPVTAAIISTVTSSANA